MEKFYQFGDTVIKICSEKEIEVPKNMEIFEIEAREQAYEYFIENVDGLEATATKFKEENTDCRRVERENVKIFYTEDQEMREIYFMGNEIPYAVTIEDQKKTRILVTSDILSMLSIDTVFGSLLSLEKRVLPDQAFILHSAFICRDGKAILFTAPSGTGKSTQADLWNRYRGTRTINGDRSLIMRKDQKWWAYGWPICGSSEICFNESFPIEAIIVLHQAPENEVHRIHGFDVVRNLLRETTVNRWNLRFYDQVIELLEKLEREVAVYDYSCNISEAAVEILDRKLNEESSLSI